MIHDNEYSAYHRKWRRRWRLEVDWKPLGAFCGYAAIWVALAYDLGAYVVLGGLAAIGIWVDHRYPLPSEEE